MLKIGQIHFVKETNHYILLSILLIIYIIFQLSSLLDKLKAMSKASKGKIGWRPLGDAQSDSYGTRRGRLVEHKNRLEALKAELEKEIEGIRAQHQLSDSC